MQTKAHDIEMIHIGMEPILLNNAGAIVKKSDCL